LPIVQKSSRGSSRYIDNGTQMTRDWEKTLPRELQDYIEAERQAARASAIAEIRLGSVKLNEPPPLKDTTSTSTAAPKDDRRMQPGDRQLPRGLGAKMVKEALQAIPASTIITVTDIRRHATKLSGAYMSFQTVRRAMEKLALRGELERIEGTDGWRVQPKSRSVS
jgi:hypothetical protein